MEGSTLMPFCSLTPDTSTGRWTARTAKLIEVSGGAHAPSRVVDRAPAVNPERSARARNAAPEAGALPIQYADVAGLCKAATLKEIEAQGGGGRSRER